MTISSGVAGGGWWLAEDGVRFQTTHRDAFAVAYRDLEMLEFDPEPHTLRIRLRGGRGYNFRSGTGTEGQISYWPIQTMRRSSPRPRPGAPARRRSMR